MSKEIEELKLQIEEINNRIIELENKEKEESSKWGIPEEHETYYSVVVNGDIEDYIYDIKSNFDKDIIRNLNYYKTKEQAERKAFEQLLHRKLEKFAYENNEEEIEWNDNCPTEKCYIYYDFDYKELNVGNASEIKDYGQIYFTSEKIAEKAIEQFKEDLIRYFTSDK